MRDEALDFAVGFVPLAVTGLVLTLASGRDALVYCGTRTPIPPCSGTCALPCAQVAWVPYSWGGLYLLLIGAALGAFLLVAGIPYPRTRAPTAMAAAPPERNVSATTHFSGCDTMPPRPDKSRTRRGFVRGQGGPSAVPGAVGRPAGLVPLWGHGAILQKPLPRHGDSLVQGGRL